MRSGCAAVLSDDAPHACLSCPVHAKAVCHVLGHEQLARLGPVMHVRTLSGGAVLYHEGDRARGVFTIRQGMVKLYKLLDGRCQVTGFALPGDLIGLAQDDRYAHSVEAIEGAELCCWEQHRFCGVLNAFPPMKHAVLERSLLELATVQRQLLLLGRKTARERVATFLLQMAARVCRGRPNFIPLPMSRTDIADHLGLTVETVSRTFTALRKEGLIDLGDRRGARVLSFDGLRAVAEP